MTKEDLKTLIENTLSIPVFDGEDTILYPGATLEVTDYTPGIIGDGKTKRRKATAYINLWYLSKTARDTAAFTLLGVLEQTSGMAAPDMDVYYDTSAKKHRAVFNFEIIYLESEEEGTDDAQSAEP